MPDRILLVDDEPNLLSGIIRSMRRSPFEFASATSGAEALELISKSPSPFSLIVSDYRMPGIDGVRFLEQARLRTPDSVRILFTGQADLQAVSDAVNRGSVFRVLLKPCPSDQLSAALAAGVEQHRLIVAEREVLEQTLRGSVQVLADILAAVSPAAFSRASRIRPLCRAVAEAMGHPNLWEAEIAALLSQVGYVAVPSKVLERHAAGLPLAEPEQQLVAEQARVGAKLLQPIARLGRVAEAIALQDVPFSPAGRAPSAAKLPSGEAIPLLARVLKATLDYDSRSGPTRPTKAILEDMRRQAGQFDPKVLDALEAAADAASGASEIAEVEVAKLQAGMLLADDIKDRHGVMLIRQGQEISQVLAARLLAFSQMGAIKSTVLVQRKAPIAAAPPAAPASPAVAS